MLVSFFFSFSTIYY